MKRVGQTVKQREDKEKERESVCVCVWNLSQYSSSVLFKAAAE